MNFRRLYWCEYGSNPGIYFISIDNLVIEKVKVEGDISAVTIDAPSNSLYMFDASTNHILQCQLDGKTGLFIQCYFSLYLSARHVLWQYYLYNLIIHVVPLTR